LKKKINLKQKFEKNYKIAYFIKPHTEKLTNHHVLRITTYINRPEMKSVHMPLMTSSIPLSLS